MKIYDVAIASDQYKGVPINQPIVLYEIPQGATFLKLQLISPHLHIIYSMEDEPVSKEEKGLRDYTLAKLKELDEEFGPNIWKQQQDLKQPPERWDNPEYQAAQERTKKAASRKLNTELLRQYKDKVTELEELLK